ncbi:MAG TPA: HlyD family type I secretion periplasmic adaptor subunit [Beijerinckiaceae bacterium]|jgi:hemolysin D|nr:HlyD family type I secretion periplasmic adaptor subunit [Beijerinckiaceae bacterium]
MNKPVPPPAASGPRAPRRRRADNAFLAPALEILETPPSPVRVALIWIICALAAASIAWAYFGRIDVMAVAQGKFQPTGRVKVIEPLEAGKVAALHVFNGTRVAAGDVLVEFDRSSAEADAQSARAGLASSRAEAARRAAALEAARARQSDPAPTIAWPEDIPQALRAREQRVFAADLGQVAAALASLEAQRAQKQAERDQLLLTIATQKNLVATLQERVDMRTHLVAERAGAKAAVIDATETLQYQITQLAIQQGQLASASRALDVIDKDKQKSIEAFLADNAQKLSEAERQAEDLEQKLAKAIAVIEHLTLKAPISGTVQASALTTIGQVVSSGQEVMRIVPEEAALEIEVYVLNKDIGFVKRGQEAVVKVESFPFTQYGTILARVTRVARDAIPEPEANQNEGDPARAVASSTFAGAQRTQNLVFPVTLEPEASTIGVDGRLAPLTSGMAATVEIKTGGRRILEFIFSPLVEIAGDSLHER